MAILRLLAQSGAHPKRTSGADLAHATLASTYLVTNTSGAAIPKCTAVYFPTAGSIEEAQADDEDTSAVVGLVWDDEIANLSTGLITLSGVLEAETADWDNVTGDAGGLTAGELYYLSAATAGELTTDRPTGVGEQEVPVGVALSTTRMLINPRSVSPVRVLDGDLTLHISTTGNDTTGDGSSGAPYATLNRVAQHIGELIPAGFTITVDVADGVYTFTESYKPSWPYGAALTWEGRLTNHGSGLALSNFDGSYSTDGTISGLQFFDMDVAVPAGVTVNVDEFIVIRSATGGTNPQACNGQHKVIAWDGVNELATVRVWSRDGVNALPSGSITANVIQHHVVLKFDLTSGAAVDVTGPFDGGEFSGIIIEGNDSVVYDGVSGVETNSGGVFRGNNVGIHNFLVGLEPSGGSVAFFNNSWISKCKNNGIQCFNARVDSANCFINGAGAVGRGILAQTGSVVKYQTGWIVGSGNDFAIRADQSDVQCLSLNAYFGDGSTTGIMSQVMSRVDARSSTISGYTLATDTDTGGQIQT